MMTDAERKTLADKLIAHLPDHPQDAFFTAALITANVAVQIGYTKSIVAEVMEKAFDQMKSADRRIN